MKKILICCLAFAALGMSMQSWAAKPNPNCVFDSTVLSTLATTCQNGGWRNVRCINYNCNIDYTQMSASCKCYGGQKPSASTRVLFGPNFDNDPKYYSKWTPTPR